MSEYKASGDRHLKSSDEAWSAYRKVIDRITRELGDLKYLKSWVRATDGSVTPSSESLDEAIAVLEADGLPFTYSFTSFKSTDGDRATVYVWTDQRWVMITAHASSASRAKGLVAVGTDLLDALGTTEAGTSAYVLASADAEPGQRKIPTWAKIVGAAVLTGGVGFGYAYLTAWMNANGLMP